MKKPDNMEEFDGYEMPTPRDLSQEEQAEIMRKVSENRKKVLKDNNIIEPAQK